MATYDQDDYWGQAVTLFTGYPMPSRAGLFDKLKSKEGIPLFRMDIRSQSMRNLTDADYTAITGWHVANGDDYILTFVGTPAGTDGSNHQSDDFSLYQAHIVLIGVPVDGNGRARLLDAGETFAGMPFTGHYGDQWDNSTLAQYVSGAKAALDALADGEHSTAGFSYNGASVADKDAVKLKSFEQTAQSFDRAKKFFADQAVVLKQWEDSLGGDDSAWQGQAAGVFRDLVHQLRKNYDAYVEQMGGATYLAHSTSVDYYTPRSPYSDALIKAQKDLWRQTVVLRTAWIAWANTGQHDPHRGLLEMLNELTAWVLENNVHQVKHESRQGKPHYTSTAAFKQSHPVYGNLNDVNNWKKVGEAAVKRWTTYIELHLIPYAKQALSDLNNAWIEALDPLEETLDAKDTTSLTEQYEGGHDENGNGNGSTDDLRESLDNALNDLNTGINNSISGLGDNLSGIGDSLTGVGDSLGNGLNDLTTGLGAGLNGLTSNLGAGLGNLSDLNTGLTSNLGDGLNLGSGLGSGLTNPGGGTTTLNPDGTLTTTYPDGTVTTVDPDTGVATTTDPDGHVTTTDLGSGLSDLGDLGHGLDLGDLDDFDHLSDSLGSLNSNLSGLSHSLGTGSGTPLTSGLSGLDSIGSLSGFTGVGSATTGSSGLLGPSFEGYDDSPYTSGALGAPTGTSGDSAEAAESGAANGMPMMPMGGMGGAPGATGGQSGTGERVRNVLTEPGTGGPLGGRSRRTGKNRSTADDEAEGTTTTGRARVSTSSTGSPFGPQSDAGRRDGRRTESSGAEERASWLADEEDEDVWGADEGGAPSVIGR